MAKMLVLGCLMLAITGLSFMLASGLARMASLDSPRVILADWR